MQGPRVDLPALLNTVTRPLWLLNDRHRLIWANEAFWTVTGLVPEQALGNVCRPGSAIRVHGDGTLAGLAPPDDPSPVHFQPWPASPHASKDTPATLCLLALADADGAIVGFLGVGLETPWPARSPDRLTIAPPELQQLRQQLLQRFGTDNFVSASPLTHRLLRRAKAYARCADANPVLISGPAGAGKTHLATVLYQLSGCPGPLLFFHPPEPIEEADAELFGTAQGGSAGLWKNAAGGMLVIEEAERLRERTVQQILDRVTVSDAPKVVLITGTEPAGLLNQWGARTAVAAGTFHVDVPPLRARREDILPLAAKFIEDYNQQHDASIEGLSDEAAELLMAYDWPGNVRQLREVVEAACVAVGKVGRIEGAHIPKRIQGHWGGAYPPPTAPEPNIDLEQLLRDVERRVIEYALWAAAGNKASAARLLGLSRAKLLRRLEALGLASGD